MMIKIKKIDFPFVGGEPLGEKEKRYIEIGDNYNHLNIKKDDNYYYCENSYYSKLHRKYPLIILRHNNIFFREIFQNMPVEVKYHITLSMNVYRRFEKINILKDYLMLCSNIEKSNLNIGEFRNLIIKNKDILKNELGIICLIRHFKGDYYNQTLKDVILKDEYEKVLSEINNTKLELEKIIDEIGLSKQVSDLIKRAFKPEVNIIIAMFATRMEISQKHFDRIDLINRNIIKFNNNLKKYDSESQKWLLKQVNYCFWRIVKNIYVKPDQMCNMSDCIETLFHINTLKNLIHTHIGNEDISEKALNVLIEYQIIKRSLQHDSPNFLGKPTKHNYLDIIFNEKDHRIREYRVSILISRLYNFKFYDSIMSNSIRFINHINLPEISRALPKPEKEPDPKPWQKDGFFHRIKKFWST